MDIEINITNEDGELIFHATSKSVEMAVQELYAFDRSQERKADIIQEEEDDV